MEVGSQHDVGDRLRLDAGGVGAFIDNRGLRSFPLSADTA
jgi:hypothetical protein